jgi:catechol 2,3-dioxygenase-like lactoylglutathione lyase family enzyme
MIHGAHFLLYSSDPDADRAFFRDVLGFRSVDAGGGWLIFGLPPSELAVHPAEPDVPQQPARGHVMSAAVYLMCDDVRATVSSLEARGVACTPLEHPRWGITTTVALPSGGSIGLYQPLHPTALERP